MIVFDVISKIGCKIFYVFNDCIRIVSALDQNAKKGLNRLILIFELVAENPRIFDKLTFANVSKLTNSSKKMKTFVAC